MGGERREGEVEWERREGRKKDEKESKALKHGQVMRHVGTETAVYAGV